MDIQSLHQTFIQSAGICTDSRNVLKDQLFFALSGLNFDGNFFAPVAIEKGAKLAIIDKAEHKTSDKYVLVPNVLECLQELANFHRKWLGLPVIAITGTNGKTTTKELVSRVLQKKHEVGYTQGNLNNHIGVPLTLLSFSKKTEIGIVEMGANHQNEISHLCRIALPDYGIINNIGKAHLEGFGSYEGVIKAKSELYQYCRDNKKKLFVNADDKLLMELSEGIERILYGKQGNIDIDEASLSADPFLAFKWKGNPIQTRLVGGYNLNNVLAAISVGLHFEIDTESIIQAISAYQPQNNRSQLTKTENNTLIIDAYNANPSSMELSILNFANIKNNNKLLILGEMYELGDSTSQEHQKIIDLIESLDFKNVFLIGKNFSSNMIEKKHPFSLFESTDDLLKYLSENKISGYTILLKASRGVRLEKALDFL